jgi:hypothetical protein
MLSLLSYLLGIGVVVTPMLLGVAALVARGEADPAFTAARTSASPPTSKVAIAAANREKERERDKERKQSEALHASEAARRPATSPLPPVRLASASAVEVEPEPAGTKSSAKGKDRARSGDDKKRQRRIAQRRERQFEGSALGYVSAPDFMTLSRFRRED